MQSILVPDCKSMTIPDYESIMLPLLRYAGDGLEHSLRDAINALALNFDLTEQEQQELLPSGRQATFDNRVGWARTYMKKAGLVSYPQRGSFQITTRGSEVLKQNPKIINGNFLKQFPEFVEFQTISKKDYHPEKSERDESISQTPLESLEYGYQKLRKELALDVIEKILACSPNFFEQLVVDLLVQMGYGGSRQDAGSTLGKSGDGGIDGIIKEDKLGLDILYIQAKRWDNNTVGRPEIQKFVGALHGKRARKGVFITTSKFSHEAHDYAESIDSKVILIDGPRLAELMIDHGLGVSTVATYDIKKVDSDYFIEE